jgi:hypothetical protein
MKKIIFSSLLVIVAIAASAQGKIRLNAYGSYVFDDGFDVYNDVNTYYNGKIEAGAQWGAGVEYVTNEYFSVELLYLHKSSDVPANFKFEAGQPARSETFDLKHDYIMASFNGLKPSSSGKVEGYFGFMAGVLIANVTNPVSKQSESNTDFAWGGKLGLNYWMGPKVGIKLQANLLSASKATGGDVYWGYWGPIYLDTYSTVWQFGLGGGLTFRLGK